MAHSSMTTKAILNIQESVMELKRSFFTEHTLINDDNPALHRLEEKLELVLSVGLKEKPGVFGGKKSYWDYISACLSSLKRPHQGLKFVKSFSELKTSVGRGRAFIRFCLMQNCLADTIQSCFIDKRTTRDFYSEQCLPLQPKLWSSLVAYLYDLNEIHFDLNPQHAELDVSWPSFARKLFVSSENEVFSGRNLSSNVTHFSKINEDAISISTEYMHKERAESTQSLVDENSELEANVLCLQKKCDTLEKEIFCAVNEDNKHKVFTSVSEGVEGFLPQGIPDFTKMNDKYCYEANSLSDTKASSNSMKKEFNFNVKEDTQCVCNCNLKNDLMDSTKTSNESCTSNLKMSNSTSKLILEMKELIENLSNNMCTYSKNSEVLSSFTHLKNILDYFEINSFTELEKVKECEIFKQNYEDFSNYLKSLALKQNALIDSLSERVNSSLKENESLYEKMHSLKDRLHSYGLLKSETDSSPNVQSNSLPSNESLYLDSNPKEDMNCSDELHDYVSKDSFDSLHIFKESLSKLGTLNTQATSLQLCLNSSHKLNDNLIARVQDQEKHMKGITKELEEAHQLLSVMRQQHQKLQSAENIIKYDLQEKRKLLTRLKQQLESTREDCNLVRIKNSKSKSEWESLRKEFALRTKETSEESGFIDDKGLEDQCAIINTSFDHNITKVIPNIEICKNIDEVESKYILKKNRLQMLEEQCKLLCSNLVNSSKKREEIDCRLESWCKAIEKSHEVSEPEKLSQVSDTHNEFKSETGEVVSENMVDSGSDLGSSLLSSEIGSVNSDCICIPNSSSTISSDICFTLEPLKIESLISSKISNLESSQSILLESIDFRTDPVSNSNVICNATNHENLGIMEGASCCSSIESLEGVEDCSLNSQYVSEVDSSNYEDSKLERTVSCKTRKSLALETEILKLREEKSVLETKYCELEKTSVMLSSQLSLKSQQLKLIEAAKEQENKALQFQLNSEVLKYERTLKEFAVNNDGLNDMKQKVNDQEELILALEEALAEIQSERESEKDLQWEQLQDIQLALVAREEECILLSADLEKLEDFKKYCLNDREIMENEIIHLRNDSKELQKKIIKLLKEKDILWQRNDHLTFLQKIQIDDRWMNDHEVSKCIGCSCTFSFLLRKHHCRQCGRIFCNSCSNNWLLTASSNKQIRICNECYMQHLEIKKVVRRDSNVQYCEDSDDEAAVDNASFTLNGLYISGNRPSIADSIVSLPVMQETSLTPKCRFTSVPQLYMCDENQHVYNTNSVDPILTSQLETTVSGKNGDLLIKAGEEAELPVLNEGNGTALHWKFTPNNEAIPIKLIHENSNSDSKSQQTVLHQSACETEGVIQLRIPGLYKFSFDNTSRLTSMLLNYTFKNTISKEESTCS